jgi:hypothetical protein
MSKTSRWLLPLIFIAFVGYIVYSTMSVGQFRCRVCMEFQGATACRTASGATKEDALKTAKDNACAQLTSGMGNVRQCDAQEPVSVEWIN